MVKKKLYKLMFREKGQKKYYNFYPTIRKTGNPRYSEIDSMPKAKGVKRELQKGWKDRTWKIKRKK